MEQHAKNQLSKQSIQICPSILSADFGYLALEAKRAEESGADRLHIDVMDGHFVPNLTLGPQVVAAINRSTDMWLDVHLMMYNPYAYIERFVEAGADALTIHFEATEDVEDTLTFIRRCGVKAGLAFNPETSMSMIPKYLDKCDMILLMTVNPGFGGQEFMHDVLEKVQFTRSLCNQLNIRLGGVTEKSTTKKLPPFDIQVDGGISEKNVYACTQAGANVIVAGTSLYHQKDLDLKHAVTAMRQAAQVAIM